MKWVTDAGFDFSCMAPAEMILARHVEILREDNASTKSLVKLFGGPEMNPLLIKAVPLGKQVDPGPCPMLYAMLPLTDRSPIPGANLEKVTIRDVVRFSTETVTSEEPIWEPGLATVISHLIGVVQKFQQLPFATGTHGPDLGTVVLANRVDLTAATFENAVPQQEGAASVWELSMDWIYPVQVNAKTIPPRLFALTSIGA